MPGPVFNAYHAWLGIPPKDQPANHYRLLGLELLESNLDVIEAAADRQMGFVRQYQSGEHAVDAARILNELAQARLCLLKSATKTAYDAKLSQQLAPPEPEELSFGKMDGGRLKRPPRKKKSASKAFPANQLLVISGSIAAAIVVLAVMLLKGRGNPPAETAAQPVSVAAGATESTKVETASNAVAPPRAIAESPKTGIAAAASDGMSSKPADSTEAVGTPLAALAPDPVKTVVPGNATGLAPAPAAPAPASSPTPEPSKEKRPWQGWPMKAPLPAIPPFNAEQAQKHQEDWGAYLKTPVEFNNSIGMKFRLVPPCEFMMGSTTDELDEALAAAGNNEDAKKQIRTAGPRHNVILNQPIHIGVHEVTQGQYEKIMGKNPSHYSKKGKGKSSVAGEDTTNYPVEIVTWYDAVEFCNKLSQKEKRKPCYFRDGGSVTILKGTGYRLPTEAEWEFACRAGTSTRFWTGDKTEDVALVGWFNSNSGHRTHPVGDFQANPFGLFDVYGNAWELIQDGWDPDYYGEFTKEPAMNPGGPNPVVVDRCMRGGCCFDPPSTCQSSKRNHTNPNGVAFTIGFRVVLVAPVLRSGRP
jgi:formylglycine-generating enzyme required for sulfatase activity